MTFVLFRAGSQRSRKEPKRSIRTRVLDGSHHTTRMSIYLGRLGEATRSDVDELLISQVGEALDSRWTLADHPSTAHLLG